MVKMVQPEILLLVLNNIGVKNRPITEEKKDTYTEKTFTRFHDAFNIGIFAGSLHAGISVFNGGPKRKKLM
jgi:hypothetical protein